jgi:hypothetical protein
MELYITGAHPLIEPPACPRWYMDRSNECSHVASGRVDSSDPENKACPLLATSPRLVLHGYEQIDIRPLAAENLLQVQDSAGTRYIHARDGADRTIEEGTVAQLREHVEEGSWKSMWILPGQSSGSEDDLFGDDYPRGPVSNLGLLTSSGSLFMIKQDPFDIKQLARDTTRKPFAHAIFRQECNNGQNDVWPSVVFAEQPAVVYRLRFLEDLNKWLLGESLDFHGLSFASHVTSLVTSRGRGEQCCALTADGKVYHWTRDSEAGTRSSATLENALDMPLAINSTCTSSDFEALDMPPVRDFALGGQIGIAVTRNGEIYVFTIYKPGGRDINTPHLTDLDDRTSEHRISSPFMPQRSSINDVLRDDGQRSTFIAVAAGDEHVVALTAEGKVFAAGSGFHGALGIGDKQFQLDNGDPKSYEWNHDAQEYSEDWQEVEIPRTEKKVVKIAAGADSTLLVCQSVSHT